MAFSHAAALNVATKVRLLLPIFLPPNSRVKGGITDLLVKSELLLVQTRVYTILHKGKPLIVGTFQDKPKRTNLALDKWVAQ